MNITNLEYKRSSGSSDAERINNEGINHIDQGELERALERFNAAIKNNDELLESYHNRGIVRLHLAIFDFLLSLGSSPTSNRNPNEVIRDFYHFVDNVICHPKEKHISCK